MVDLPALLGPTRYAPSPNDTVKSSNVRKFTNRSCFSTEQSAFHELTQGGQPDLEPVRWHSRSIITSPRAKGRGFEAGVCRCVFVGGLGQPSTPGFKW